MLMILSSPVVLFSATVETTTFIGSNKMVQGDVSQVATDSDLSPNLDVKRCR